MRENFLENEAHQSWDGILVQKETSYKTLF